MALKGNLRDFSITQLLNLVNLAQKTGTMVFESPVEVAQIAFRGGKLAYAQFGHEDSSLAGVLLRTKKISAQQYRVIRERSEAIADKELGLLLINAGYLSQEDVINSLQQYFMTIVRRLFSWDEGAFHFESGSLPSNGNILVRLDLENLIIEGSRQQRERAHLQEEIPNLDMALRFSDRPGTNIRNVNLSVEEWRVVSYVNPKNSMHQIARATRMSDLEIRRVIFGLLQAGLVEIIRPSAAATNVPVNVLPKTDRREQKSLINRLIDRIRSL